MCPALVVGNRVDFVHDDRFYGPKNFPALSGGEQYVQRLGGCYQDVRRPHQHGTTFSHYRIPGAHGRPDWRHQQPALGSELEDFSKRDLQIFLYIVSECLQGRNIQDLRFITQIAGKSFAYQSIDTSEERGQRLSRSSWRGDERRFSRENVRPTLLLRLGRNAKASEEPLPNHGMCPIERGRRGNLRWNVIHGRTDGLCQLFGWLN